MKYNPIRYKVCRAYLSATNFIRSLAHAGVPHIGTRVIYKGKEMYISTTASFPKWTLRELDDSGFRKPVHATPKEFKMVKSFTNIAHNATYLWHWYKLNWLNTDSRLMSEGHKVGKRF